MGKLEGKIALITGGNSGIGLATAKQSVNEGAYVFITGRRNSELAAAVKEIGGNLPGVQGDVACGHDVMLDTCQPQHAKRPLGCPNRSRRRHNAFRRSQTPRTSA